MEVIWQLIESIVIPIITYGSESWNPSKTEYGRLERILHKALKITLGVPQTTPTTILMTETAFLSIELMINKK